MRLRTQSVVPRDSNRWNDDSHTRPDPSLAIGGLDVDRVVVSCGSILAGWPPPIRLRVVRHRRHADQSRPIM